MRVSLFPLLWASLAALALAGPVPAADIIADDDAGQRLPQYTHAHLLSARASSSASGLLKNATTNDIAAARAIVDDAIGRMAVLNAARQANPVRNHYRLRPGTRVGKRNADADDMAPPPPLLEITDEIAHAAALLAELEAAQQNTTELPQKRAGAYWMEGLVRKGSVPWGDDSGYKVFRNVVADYGADPTGKKDSTKAIQKAIDDGKRCGAGCSGSTTKNAIVYFPSGQYLVSSTINVYFGTQMVGDANNWPRLVASSSFVGRLGVLSTDQYVDNGGTGPDGLSLEWYINTARFYSQIRNFRIDISATYKKALVCGIHYQVAQATSLENIEFIAKTGTKQQGMFAENGSGGVMSDITFSGGDVGFYGGNQQFSASRMTFKGCTTAAQIIWDWGWVWKSTIVDSVDVGFRLVSDDGAGFIGSVAFMDSKFSNIGKAAIIMSAPADKAGQASTGLVLDNVNLGGNVVDNSTNKVLGSGYYQNYIIGPVYDSNGKRTWRTESVDYTREPSLLGSAANGLKINPYFERARNQYTSLGVGDFVHLKDGGAKGDGSSDDTKAVQDFIFKYGDGSKVIYVDAGTYLLTDTVVIPKDAKIVGETWAQFAASGDKFSDPKKPHVMLKVGIAGEEGTVEMQDLLLTTKGGTAGAILMEWNVHAKSAGAAAVWDVHARVGGAAGTGLTPAECPPVTSGTNPPRCQAASMLFHITKTASGYFDNMWLWVADHMIDQGALPTAPSSSGGLSQVSVYSARGMMVESQKATWLYGTASEHSVFYQYNFKNARNIFTTMLQSESPYYQPTPQPPAPFEAAAGAIYGDPDYSHCKDGKGGDLDGCDASWAVIMTGCANVHVGSAGTYSWFSTYSQDCIDKQACQKALWQVRDNYDGVRLQNIISIGAKNIMAAEGKGVLASDNMGVTSHPSWSHISLFQPSSKGKVPGTVTPPSSGGGGGDNDKCSDNDNTFQAVSMPQGDFISLGYPADAEVSQKFITIVNLTPYKFVKTSNHSYQMYDFDFGDVPSGRARPNGVMYGAGNIVDCNGEAYYRVDGTDKKFVVRTSTDENGGHDYVAIFDLTGMGGGQRETPFVSQGVGLQLVITGSVEYGFVTTVQTLSTGNNTANWMHRIESVIGDRDLRHVVMPGSHDGGMSTIDWTLVKGGAISNTQTQGLAHYDQLRAGSRYFDMRLVSVRGGGYYAAHVNDEHSKTMLGALGDHLSEIINDANRFMDENPGEVIVWYIRYMLDFTDGAPKDWDKAKASDFFDHLEGLKYRCKGLDTSTKLERRPIKTYMDANDGKGCILLLTDDAMRGKDVQQDRPASGIYNHNNYISITDVYADKGNPGEVASYETQHLQGVMRDGGDADKFYIMQWQVTPNILASTYNGLDSFAMFASNPTFYWAGVNAMDPYHFPTVILEDYIGLLDKVEFGGMMADMATLCTGLNLYLVSQNCKVSTHRSPLHLNTKRSMDGIGGIDAIEGRDVQDSAAASADSRYAFHGVVYANGTVDAHPPPGFHLGRVAVFKAGTRFDNGTVLAVDTPNPDYNAPY